MWYSSSMPKVLTERDVENALAAAAHAESVRHLHRRRTRRGDPQREQDIKLALERIATAMKPVRSYLCAYPYRPATTTIAQVHRRVWAASQALQAERRRLWKMQER